MLAAASDVDNTSLIDLLAVKRGHSIMCFDAVAAPGQASETADLHRRSCRAQSKSWSTCAVAMHESERRQTERSESVARLLRGHTAAIEGVSRNFQAESVPLASVGSHLSPAQDHDA